MEQDAQPPINRDELLVALRALQVRGDVEAQHWAADVLLLRYINDPEITEAFDAIDKWYA